MKKIRDQLGLYAKEKEEFEQKKRVLAEEMSKGKQNMEKIRKGIRITSLSPSTTSTSISTSTSTSTATVAQTPSASSSSCHEVIPDEEILIKRIKSFKINRPDTVEQQMKSLPTPTGPKISDWCYNSPLESLPPVLRSQEMYEDVRFLGRGSYGTVDLVKNKEENKL